MQVSDLTKLKPKELVEMEPQPEQRTEICRRLERLEKCKAALKREVRSIYDMALILQDLRAGLEGK